MRKETFLSYNMTTADAANPDGLISIGRQFDFIGDVETEEMILCDGDESLCLGYHDVKCYKDIYVGDMIDYKATLIKIGNSSRDCKIGVYKLATPSFREGKTCCKKGDMVWFDEPILCSEGYVRLVVKKYLQRGSQPDGLVENPWFDLDDFPNRDGEIIDVNEQNTITFRYRMSNRDVFYLGGLINGARNITLMSDTAVRLMAKRFNNTGHCIEVKKIRLYTPSQTGDYMEYIARIKKIEGKKVLIEVRAFKIIEVPKDPPYPSSIDVLSNPVLSSVVQFIYEIF